MAVLLCGCDNKAEPVEDNANVTPQQQQQYERGHIETHSTE